MNAVIFDMDGVIIDSEPLWREAERHVFAEVGLELSDADCERTMGIRTDEVVAYWFARSPWSDGTPGEVEHRLIQRMQTLIAERGRAMHGLRSALEVVRTAGLRSALASSSSPVLIDAVLRKLELTATFDVVRSAIHETHGKPHPAVFLSTARDLGLQPSQCAVIEDSAAGVQAASAAGMRVVAVPPPHLFDDPAYDLADAKLNSLEELTLPMIS
ncbi:MAG: hexitol phosphatase HxpB [Acidobacteriota bacterium]|nr:hexitol phosphatase HxpB [Acidobacteriota bacterium]